MKFQIKKMIVKKFKMLVHKKKLKKILFIKYFKKIKIIKKLMIYLILNQKEINLINPKDQFLPIQKILLQINLNKMIKIQIKAFKINIKNNLEIILLKKMK